MTRLSVLMPAYNAVRYIHEAIESVLAQGFTDFEFIIVDDGSIDETPAILSAYEVYDRRVRVLRNQTNLGLIASLNIGLAAAEGELIARIDADDLCRADRFERQVAFLDSHPDHVLVGASYNAIDEDGRTLWEKITRFDDAQVRWIARFRTPLGHSGAMFRKISPSRGPWRYDENFEAREDYDLWLRMLEVGRAAVLPEPLFSYRIHNQTITGRMGDAMARNGLILALRNANATFPVSALDAFAIFLRAYHMCEKVNLDDVAKIAAAFDAMLNHDIAAHPGHRVWFRKQAAGVLAEGLLVKGQANDGALIRTFLLAAYNHLPWLVLRILEDRGVAHSFWKRRSYVK